METWSIVSCDAADPSSRKPPYKVQWREKPRVLVYGQRTGLPLDA
jgi:hypothetical protein